MKQFTGWEYLLINAANGYGLDKLTFEERIDWALSNLDRMFDKDFIEQGDLKDRPLYLKAAMAINNAREGKVQGHLVGLDAICSGIQIMSCLTGCVQGATSTGLVLPNVRSDAYTDVTNGMNAILGGGFNISRKDAKSATMKTYYGSKLVPQILFGANTPELNAFYQAASQVAPGPWSLLQDLLASWRPFAKVHFWKLPDGYDAVCKVMTDVDARIEVDELAYPGSGNHSTFMYTFYENTGKKKGKANAANVVHSVDGWVLRNMHRRCNYDPETVKQAAFCIEMELIERAIGTSRPLTLNTGRVGYYIEQFRRSTMADPVILPSLDHESVQVLTTDHLQKLMVITQGMLSHPPFELVTVHDEFRCLPNHCNQMRWHYKEILAEIADGNLLDDLLTQLYGMPTHFTRNPTNLGALIRNSNYGLT